MKVEKIREKIKLLNERIAEIKDLINSTKNNISVETKAFLDSSRYPTVSVDNITSYLIIELKILENKLKRLKNKLAKIENQKEEEK